MSNISPSEEKDLPVAELLKRLSTTEKGLSPSEAAKRLQQYGPNEIVEKKRSAIVAFLRYFWGPIPWMIEAAAVISAFLQNWDDLVIITALLVTNVIVRSWQEKEASNAIELLKQKLALRAKVLTRRNVDRSARKGARPRRHRAPAPREHRPCRHEARRRRIPPDRRIGADRGIPARGEAPGRRSLLLLDCQTGRDERAGGHHGDEHLLRADHEAGRGGAYQEPFPGGGGQDRRLPHRTRRGHGNDHVGRRPPPPSGTPRDHPVRAGPDRRGNPRGHAHRPLRVHDGRSVGAGQEGGHSQQAGRHRRDGRRGHPVRGQDGHDHEERAEPSGR